MKSKRNLWGIATLALCLGLAACSEDNVLNTDIAPNDENEMEQEYSQGQVTNSELRAILEQKGLHFDEQGHLLLDEAADNLTSLDLSGKHLSDYKELSVLPNLVEVNLSNNDFGPTFDFGILPAQITAVDLTDNEIYEYKNLVTIEAAENGDEKVTLVRDLSKLYLPETAKYNCNEIVAYYHTDKEVDMKLVDAPYTTLREVPDPLVREILQTSFPSVFDDQEGDKIDLSKRFTDPTEAEASIFLAGDAWGGPLDGVTSLEGVEYITMNKGYKGSMFVASFTPGGKVEMPYIVLNPALTKMVLINVSTPKIDFSKATNLCTVQITNNEGLEWVDLSNCTLLGQRGAEAELNVMNNSSSLRFVNCTNLKKLLLPKEAKNLEALELANTNAIEEIDLARFDYIGTLIVAGDLKCDISYPDYKWDHFPSARFGTSEAVFAKEETVAFCRKYNDNLKQTLPNRAAGLPDFYWRDHLED